MSTGPYLCLYQISSKYFKPDTQEFGVEIYSGKVTRKQLPQRLPFICMWHVFWSLSTPLQNIIKIFKPLEVLECTRIWLRYLFSGVYKKKNKARVILLACDTTTWPNICPSKILLNFLRQCWRQPAQDSSPGEISKKQKMRVVLLACGTPTVPYLCLYQISLKYFKPLGRYSVHKHLV